MRLPTLDLTPTEWQQIVKRFRGSRLQDWNQRNLEYAISAKVNRAYYDSVGNAGRIGRPMPADADFPVIEDDGEDF